jgi:hypothetical protein
LRFGGLRSVDDESSGGWRSKVVRHLLPRRTRCVGHRGSQTPSAHSPHHSSRSATVCSRPQEIRTGKCIELLSLCFGALELLTEAAGLGGAFQSRGVGFVGAAKRRTLTALAIFADGRNGIGRTRTGTSVSLFALESTGRGGLNVPDWVTKSEAHRSLGGGGGSSKSDGRMEF